MEARNASPRRRPPGDDSHSADSSSWQRVFAPVALMLGLVSGGASLAMGRQCGFEQYLILLPPVFAMQPGWRLPQRLAAVLATVAAWVLLPELAPQWPVVLRLDPATEAWLYRLNTALALLTLGLWTLLHANLASTTRARLRRSVSTDMLTGLMNRRSWLAAAADLRHRAEGRSRPRPLSILIADVDHLKLINDRHGNQVGDQVLGAVGSALQKGVREADLLARWGDDRFIVLISGSDGQAARMVGERLRALAQACMLRVGQEGEILPVSISLGGSRVEIAEPLDSAIARAESALGEAKQAGRNRVAMART